jgi:hypothetical protein
MGCLVPHIYDAETLSRRNNNRQLPRPRSQRGLLKRGVKRAEVITARLVEDERRWLRLAG